MTELILPRKLWAHQEEALAKMKGKRAFALLMAMRLGKTFVLLTDYARSEHEGEVSDLFVLAPGGVYRTWEGAVKSDLPKSLLERIDVHVWQSGKTKTLERSRGAFLAVRNRPRVLLMNIEALSRPGAAREMAKAFLAPVQSMMAIDESTVIRNNRSKRTMFINNTLRKMTRYRRILSGLPNPKSPLDLFPQFRFLDWRITGYDDFVEFRSRYAIVDMVTVGWGASEKEFPSISGWQNLKELKANIEPYSYRKTLDEVYDVPEKMYAFRDVEMTDEQARIYREIKEYATALIEGSSYVTATIVLAQIIRLHQIVCGYAVDEHGEVHMLPENRTGELLDLLNEYDGKAIIWVSYDINVQSVFAALEKEFGEGSTARFWGGNIKTREAEEKRFLEDPNCRWMVSTAAAGGRGRTWTVANLEVYYSNTYDLEHRSQSEERAQGVGKKDAVMYVDLRVRNTVDDKIVEALRAKIDLASEINGKNWMSWLI